MNGVIYMYTAPNGKQYIGQTFNERIRKHSHGHGGSGTAVFKYAIAKYGYDSMRYTVLHSGISTRHALNTLEAIEIISRKTLHPTGYNMKLGGSYTYQCTRNRPVQCVETGEIFSTALSACNKYNPTLPNASGILSVIDNPNRSSLGFHWCSVGKAQLNQSLSNPKTNTRVQCYETSEIFDSALQAIRSVLPLSKNSSGIFRVLDDPTKTAGGYHWVTPGNKHHSNLVDRSQAPWKWRRVVCIESGKEYESLRHAASDFGFTHGAIVNAIKRNGTAGGYHWQYAD